ncbi:hypothetical protein FNF27_07695 [Cafeteria roenbergensis]|uniref:Uncharacterized protein n=1 Tax=Cafeteria roenbergensis TaxID=33653 RepID=A0A5A8DKL3_CAFRO|nr:hypothetical protein FNF27_07695 [Cafeteria roenbergensis]
MLGLLGGNGGDQATDPSTLTYGWAIAVIIAVGANLMSNVGINTQKLALMKKAQGKPMGLVGTLWTLGFVGIVGGALCDFAALGFGAQSIVAPLGSISVVANVVVAPMILGEVPTRRDVLATLLIVAGCAVAVSFASHKDHIYPAEELFDMYRQPNFYVYFTSVVVLVLLWLLAIRWMERVQATRGSASPQYQRVFKFHRFSYAAISGIAGAQSVLFAKTCVELVTGAIAGSGAAFLTYVPTYAVLLAMALTITLQIYWLNCGLARWDALYNVPVFSSFWILVSVVGGGVFYDEFSSFGLLQALLFPVGIILAIAGVYWLSQRGAESAARRGSAASLLLHDGGWGDDAPLLERDAPAIARARATIQVADVVFTARKLGLGLVRLAVRLVDATRPARSRVAQLWAVLDIGEEAAEAFAGASGGAGHVQPGDLLVSVNGESLLDSYGAIGGDREGSDSGVFGSGAHGPSLGVGASAGGGGGGGGGAAAAATGAGMPAPELDDPDCGLIEGWGRGAADAASAQSYAGPGWSASGSAAEGARPTGEAAAAASAALAAGVGAAAASAAGPSPRRPRSGTGGLSAPGVGGAHYVIAVYVDNASAAVSPGRGIRTAHHALRNFVMDPMMGVFHMGGLVAPSVIFAAQAEEGEAAAGLTEHPLVALVDGMFPHEGAQWSRLDRLLDTFGAGADGRGGPAPAPGSLKPTAAGAAGAVRAPTLSAAGRSQSAYPARGALGGAMSGKGGYAAGDARAGTEMVAFAAGSAGVASHEAASTAAHTAARRALVRAGAVMRAQGLSPLPSDSSSSADDDESPLSPEVEASPQAGLELSAIAASASPDDDAASAAASASPARALAGAPRRRSGRRASLPLARPAPLQASASAATASSPVSPVSPSSPVSPASPPATYAQAAASGGAAAPTAAGAAHGLAAALRRVEAAKAASRARAASAGFGLDAALHKAALLNGADGALLEL